MLKRVAILSVLAIILVVPFALRPRRAGAMRTDDTLVVITPHNEAIRSEFAQAFAAWYRARTGRSIRIDWRVVGGTSDIARYLESTYTAAFENDWVNRQHRRWSADVESSFQRNRLPANASAEAKAARETFLASSISCGIDVFFGGDAYQFGKEADAGRLVASEVTHRHPEWFRDDAIPAEFGGEPFRDRAGRWFGVVLSTYGIIFNRDSWARLGLSDAPRQWSDLADSRLIGEVAVADPTKSGSVCEAFENMIQQQIQARERAADAAAVADGWSDALRMIQCIGANARYFTDSSQKPLIDVAAGDCAAGLCIDFYGRQQEEALRRRGASDRLAFVAPAGGSAASVDPIGLLRGAPHRDAAEAFIEYALSLEGQKLWAFRAGTPGGPTRFALRRMPVRRDFYVHDEWLSFRSDPDDAPYGVAHAFTYHPEWTGNLFREIGFIVRVMCLDTHTELVRAWRAVAAAPEPRRTRALEAMQNLSPVDYAHATGEIHRRLNAGDRVEEVKLATELGARFRANYVRAEAIAQGRE